MNPPRVVYDTMVFLQAAISPHKRYATLNAAEHGRVELCLSWELLAELAGVLSRPTMRAKFPELTAEWTTSFLQQLEILATAFDPVPHAFTWATHPDDDHVFNLAIAAQADFLVTWESRILNLLMNESAEAELLRKLAPRLRVVTPAAFAAELRTRIP